MHISYPHQKSQMPKQFPDHWLNRGGDLEYLGTYYAYDVYIEPTRGNLYCVYDVEPHQYYSGVGYELTRVNRTLGPSTSTYLLAAAIALLNNPQYISLVLDAH